MKNNAGYKKITTTSQFKSIIIDGELHQKFKIFCKGKSMKIGAVMQDLILLYLEKPKEVQKLIDDVKENQ